MLWSFMTLFFKTPKFIIPRRKGQVSMSPHLSLDDVHRFTVRAFIVLLVSVHHIQALTSADQFYFLFSPKIIMDLPDKLGLSSFCNIIMIFINVSIESNEYMNNLFYNGIQYTTTYLNFKPISISYPALSNLKYPMQFSINVGITNDIMRHDCCSHGL